EAMAAETAIVASGLDGYRNVATDGLNAILVEPTDVGALALALKRTLYEPGLGDRLRKAGAHRAADFSMTVLAERYAQHYLRLAPNRPARQGPATRESFLRGWRRRMMAD
ncbi:MAG: glycosyltransferase, partial [Ilumatobacteraceae bacterium]